MMRVFRMTLAVGTTRWPEVAALQRGAAGAAVARSLRNPVVAAATAAALGVLTPMPCVPVPAGAWVTGAPTALLGNMPLLTSDSKLMCAWGGVVQVAVPGQVTAMTG